MIHCEMSSKKEPISTYIYLCVLIYTYNVLFFNVILLLNDEKIIGKNICIHVNDA